MGEDYSILIKCGSEKGESEQNVHIESFIAASILPQKTIEEKKSIGPVPSNPVAEEEKNMFTVIEEKAEDDADVESDDIQDDSAESVEDDDEGATENVIDANENENVEHSSNSSDHEVQNEPGIARSILEREEEKDVCVSNYEETAGMC